MQQNIGIFDLLLGPISPDTPVTPIGTLLPNEPFDVTLQGLMSHQLGYGARASDRSSADPLPFTIRQTPAVSSGDGTEDFPLDMAGPDRKIPLTIESPAALLNRPLGSYTSPGGVIDDGPGRVVHDDWNSAQQSPMPMDDVEIITSGDRDQSIAAKYETITNLTSRDIAGLLATRSGVLSTMQNAPVADGMYRILDSVVGADTLELTVVSDDRPTEIVKITLPIDIMDDFATEVPRQTGKATAHPQRVALDTSISEVGRVSELLARLNLKELHISSNSRQSVAPDLPKSPVASAHQSGETLTIQLTGERLSESMALIRDLPREQVGMRIMVSRPLSTVTHTQSAHPISDSVESATTDAESPKTHVPARFMVFDDVTRRLNEHTGRIELIPHSTKQAHDDSPLNQTAFAHDNAQSMSHQRTIEPVRFTLPDDIRTALKPGGRSVTISIDPENLGPARLHLAMRESALSLRVTVDTPQARTIVEHSLDQLTQQLQRAGIKIDLIEVNVAGDQAQHRFFESNHGMRRKVRMIHSSDDTVISADAASVLIAAGQAAGTVGPYGVNLYA